MRVTDQDGAMLSRGGKGGDGCQTQRFGPIQQVLFTRDATTHGRMCFYLLKDARH